MLKDDYDYRLDDDLKAINEIAEHMKAGEENESERISATD